ncbi:MAG: T9SS type A sorting domain-containing protein [Krumholzibacteria bacterium]|nr:T9SS type A sorting domain-containing protein [Candidatus Krumholzibacteria bacterium]
MKTIRRFARSWPAVPAILASLAGSALGGTPTPHLLPLQGRVTDAVGALPAAADLTVRIFDAATGGTLVYDSGLLHQGAVERGLFAIMIGDALPVLLDNTRSYWLEVEVDGDEIVGDAAAGRLEFYPGGGDNGRPDLESRLAALEGELGVTSAGPAAGAPRDKAGTTVLANAQLGLGAFRGSGPAGSVVALMPDQTVGAFATATHQLRLQAVQVHPTTGPVTIIVDATPDSLGIGWRLTGPAALDSTGTGDAVLTDLYPGTYTLDWLDVPGWYHACTDPAVVEVASDSTGTFACTYLPGVTVMIDPEPDFLDAGWTLSRPDRPDTSGTGDVVLMLGGAGSYTLSWLDDPCWVEPRPNPVTLAGAGLDTVAFAGTYHAGPDIIAVLDVGNDQGRQVRVQWARSCWDALGDSVEVTGYALYRRQDAYKAGGDKADYWDYLVTVPARLAATYQYVAPTLCDSTAEGGVCWSVFMVSALTGTVGRFYDSYPDSGYSLDNLAPGAPTGFSAAYGADVALHWNPAPESDFRCFRIYRGTEPGFIPEPANLVHTTVDTAWTEAAGLLDDHYKITALDFAGNESPAVAPGAISGVPTAVPTAFRLGQNRPNPFNPSTTIVFDLPAQSLVDLKVYDLSGRLVRVLHAAELLPAGTRETVWNGRDERGRLVATGVYFYRLRAGGFTATRRMTLVK